MILTLQEMSRQALERLDLDISNDEASKSKAYNFVNQRYSKIYESFLWRESVSFETVTLTESTKEYVLSKDVDKILDVFDFNKGVLTENISLNDYLDFYAYKEDVSNNNKTGCPRDYRLVKEISCKQSMTIADKVQISSDNSIDVTPNCVRIVGTSGGIVKSENITLTGITVAESVNTYDINSELEISVGTTTGVEKTLVGTVTVTEKTTTANIKSIISPEDHASFYKYISISPTPSAEAVSVTVYYRKKLRPLKKFNDIPFIDCSNEIIQGVYADLLRLDGQRQVALVEEQIHTAMVQDLFNRHSTNKNRTLQFYSRKQVNGSKRYPRSVVRYMY